MASLISQLNTVKRCLKLQETLSGLTGLDFSFYNEKAEPVGPIGDLDRFCRWRTDNIKEGQACREFCREAVLKSAVQEGVQYHACPRGLPFFVKPLVVDGVKVIVVGGRHDVEREERKPLEAGMEAAAWLVSELAGGGTGRLKGMTGMLQGPAPGKRQGGMEKLLSMLLEELCAGYGISSASLMLSEGGKGIFRTRCFYGKAQKQLEAAEKAFAAEIERAQKSSARTRVAEDRAGLEMLGLPVEINSLASLPLISGGELLGALNIFNTALGEETRTAVEAGAGLIALAVENHMLRTSVEERVRRSRQLCGISEELYTLVDTASLFKFILEKTRELSEAERGSLMLLDGELAVKFSAGLDEAMAGNLRLKPGEGIAGHVASLGAPIVVQDIETDKRLWGGPVKNRPKYKTKSFMSVPLKLEGKVAGVLNVSDKTTGGVFDAQDLDSVSCLTNQAAVALERAMYMERMEEYRRLSITDPLTGLLNRRYLNERLQEEFERSKRFGHRMCLAILDIDEFKVYNDTHGHQAGDRVLVEVTGLIRSSVRKHDVTARYGGDEFAIILPETDRPKAMPLMERINSEMAGYRLPLEGALPGKRLTVSIGVAEFKEDSKAPEELFSKADTALYRAKQAGKNRVVVFDEGLG